MKKINNAIKIYGVLGCITRFFQKLFYSHYLFQEKNQYQTIRDSDNPEPVESRFPAVCSCDRCSEATQCLSGVEPGHVDSDS